MKEYEIKPSVNVNKNSERILEKKKHKDGYTVSEGGHLTQAQKAELLIKRGKEY